MISRPSVLPRRRERLARQASGLASDDRLPAGHDGRSPGRLARLVTRQDGRAPGPVRWVGVLAHGVPIAGEPGNAIRPARLGKTGVGGYAHYEL